MKTYHENQVPWPTAKPHTSQNDRKFGRFQCDNIPEGAERVERELAKLDGGRGRITEVWIYADCAVGARLRFLANGWRDDPSVVVTFDLDGKDYRIATDRYKLPGHNLAGIAVYIESVRAQERHGIFDAADMLTFAALPAPSELARHWSEVLGVPSDATVEAINKAWRAKVRTLHPDNQATGDAAQFEQCRLAYEQAVEERGVSV